MSTFLPSLTNISAPAMPDTSSAQSYISQYDQAFQISPIILQGGIASQVNGKLLPISLLTQQSSATGTVNGQQIIATTTTTAEPFARYLVIPGGTLISQSIGTYPFANQFVAANATIQNPLTISVVMVAPVNTTGGMTRKMQQFQALQSALATHNANGGTYIVATPAFMYYGCIMTAMTDVTQEAGNGQRQFEYQIDFTQPIVTQAQAQAAQNALLSKITGGQQIVQATWYNQEQSAATYTGVTGALSNDSAALSAFGASVSPAAAASTTSGT